jgi:hypothetical protein
MGLKINVSKTSYTVFTPAGKRKNYERTYKLNIKIKNGQISINPFSTFLGIKLDLKLSYKQHLMHLSEKILSRTRLIRKITSLKLENSRDLSLAIFNSQIRSLIDYAFIPTLSENNNQHPNPANQSPQMHQALSPENIHQRHPRLLQN